VLVKGGDYKVKEIVGYKEVIAHGGTVVTIDLVEGLSTSKIISKLA
jgi:D-beta-D-heptose 7-phosphate kinase/D-beta-D-heptose 1-phosphate adenosyltransferase